MKPPSGGPMTGPIKAGIETQAMASISARLSTERISTRRPTGVIIAPPIPCTMRATTKSVSEEDAAQPIEPSTNTTIAARNTVRPPNRSAVQPLIGMNTASESRYEVTASLSANGLVPISAAIAGNDVAITVESRFSMNSATATMRATRRSRRMQGRGFEYGRTGCPAQPGAAVADRIGSLHIRQQHSKAAERPDDLYPRRARAAARLAAQRSAVRGGAQPRPDRSLPDLRPRLSRAAARSLAPRRHRRAHEARGPQASRDRRCDRAPRPPAGLFALTSRMSRCWLGYPLPSEFRRRSGRAHSARAGPHGNSASREPRRRCSWTPAQARFACLAGAT